MEKIKETTGKILYGLLFVAVIPLLLILWARHTENIVRLPVPEITLAWVYPAYNRDITHFFRDAASVDLW